MAALSKKSCLIFTNVINLTYIRLFIYLIQNLQNMKKFTFLLVFFVIAFTVNSQNSINLQNKMDHNHQKYLKFAEMIKYIDKQSSSKSSQLKSAQATLKLDSVVSWSLDLPTDKWYYDTKEEYYYNSALQNNSWLTKEWDPISKKMEITGKFELEFNNKGLVTTMLLYDMDEDTEELMQSSKFMFYYNAGGLQDSVIMYSAETTGEPLVLAMKQVYYYNDAKQLSYINVWMPDDEGEGLVHAQTITNTYNESGKIKNTTTKISFLGTLMDFSIINYEYFGSGNLKSKAYLMLSYSTGTMENVDRYTYEYLSTSKVEIYFKGEGQNWVEKDKTVSNINSVGDVSVDTYYEMQNGNWKETEKDEYSYGSVNFSDITLPYFFSNSFNFLFMGGMGGIEDIGNINFNKQVLGSDNYEMIAGVWKKTGKTTIYYSSGTSTNIKEIDNALFAAYPNPATESISFSWNGNYESLTLVLYQVTGARVLEQITSSGKSVSISDLKNGVYLYKLMDGQQSVKTGKLIKK